MRELSYEQLRLAVEGAGVGVWHWDALTDVVTWSEIMGEIYQIAPSDFPKNRAEFFELVHPEDRSLLGDAVAEVVSHKASRFSVEHRLSSTGRLCWVRCAGQASKNSKGEVVAVSGTTFDVTQEREQRESLQHNEEQLRLYSELATDYVYVAEVSEGQPLAPTIVAGSFERTTGYTHEQVAEKGGWVSVIHPDDLPGLGPVFEGAHAGKPMVAEYRITKPGGEVIWLRDQLRPELADGVLVRIVGGVQDITERRNLETQLSHAQKMEALARMASGVAHDFNNILLVISASTELLGRSEGFGEELQAEILKASQRGAELTRSLLTFARKNPTLPKKVSLNDLVKESRAMVQRVSGERITVNVELSQEHLVVLIDFGQLQLVLLNLVANARAAMPEGGALQLRLRPASPSDQPGLGLDAEQVAVLEVADNGSGIPSDVLPHIFEPFYTTKGPGEGSGLGLSTCQSVVERAHGAIRVSCPDEGGTVFSIFLPICEPSVSVPTQQEMTRSVGGRERLLFVEDDAMVRRLTKKIAENHGYTVTSCADVTEARSRFKAGAFDLLLSDVRLPDGNGASLAGELTEADPNLRVLLISGHVDEEAAKLIEQKSYAFLHKPFSTEALARALREAFERV